MARLSPDLLEAALFGLELRRDEIERKIAEIRAQLGRRGPGRPAKATEAPVETKPARKKRKLSAEGRAAIVAALKKRWAAVKKK